MVAKALRDMEPSEKKEKRRAQIYAAGMRAEIKKEDWNVYHPELMRVPYKGLN